MQGCLRRWLVGGARRKETRMTHLSNEALTELPLDEMVESELRSLILALRTEVARRDARPSAAMIEAGTNAYNEKQSQMLERDLSDNPGALPDWYTEDIVEAIYLAMRAGLTTDDNNDGETP